MKTHLSRVVVLGMLLTLCLLWTTAGIESRANAAAVMPFAGGNCGRPVCTWLAFGPQTYTRGTGDPVTVTNTFSILNPNTQYTLHVQNSGVASAVISLNGVQVLGPSDFDPNVTTIDRAVDLKLNNEIDVQLRSKPGSSLTISIVGVDNDPPVISALATPVADTFGWNNTNVVVSFTCSDMTSGVASCPAPVTVNMEGANQVVSGTATDNAGNFASTSVAINLDKTPPTIAASPVPPANNFGWNNTSVRVTFICADALSGMATCSAPVTFTTEGSNQTATGTATDKAGNTASATVVINIDETPPTISAQASPAPNPAGWNNTNVTVAFTCFDSLSGIATCPAQTVVITEGANKKISGTASDKAGNTASASASLNIDKTPPTVAASISPQPNAAGWNNTDVTIAFECSDGGSGVASCPVSQVVSSEGANEVVSGTATDVAGNSASATATINLDKTPPVVSVTSPMDGATLTDTTVVVSGTATDPLSGVAGVSCNGAQAALQGNAFTCTVALSVGRNVITVSAADFAGNTVSKSLSVSRVAPSLVSLTPNSGQQGQQNLQVTIVGQFTHWFQGTTTASFGQGITVASMIVNSATNATAVLNLDPGAVPGLRDVSVTTGAEIVALPAGFVVAAVNQPPIVNTGPNQTISLPLSEVAFTEYPIPSGFTPPNFMTVGPDGALWFAEGASIGRITAVGKITEFPQVPIGSRSQQIVGITIGPDGNLWFTAQLANMIGKITPAGVVTEYPLPANGCVPGVTECALGSIITGPDGNLWWGGGSGNYIGKITTSGEITEFSTPSSGPVSITNGPDGNLWFTEESGNIGRITLSGVITEFPVLTAQAIPYVISAGSDGNMWFTELHGNQIGKITPNGVIAEFPIPTSSSFPGGITTGPDGNLWFTEQHGNSIARITTAGVITEFPVPTANSGPFSVVDGPDGNLWFTENTKIGRVNLGVFNAPVTTTLFGSVTDDGLPFGAMLTATWNLANGPAPVSFSNPTAIFPDVAGHANPVTTSVTFTSPGTYNIDFTGSDSQLSGSASVTITVNPPQVPILLSVNPNSGQQGQQNLSISITGQFTHFVEGTTTADFGDGILVTSLTVNGTNTATAVLSIDPTAIPGARRVTLFTGTEVATLGNAFTVNAATALCIPPATGLVSWWPGEGNYLDVIGNNNGTPRGGTAFGPGVVGQAFLLNGTDALVDVGNGPSLHVSDGSFTALAWVKFNGLTHLPGQERLAPAGDMSIIDKMSASGVNVDGWRLLKQNDNRFWFCLGGRDSNRCFLPSNTVFSQMTVATGVWYHVAAVESATDFSIYVDGVLQDTRPLPTSPPFLDTNSTDLLIGSYILESSFLNGLVDEAQIYNRALTANEIQAIFQSGRAGTCQSPVLVSANPNTGQQGEQNLSVTLTGRFTHFVQGITQADFGAGVSVSSLTVNSAVSATAVLNIDAAAAIGPRQITLTTAGEVVTLANGFTVKVAAACVPPPPGMVGWWPGDGNANDIVGGNNGTLTGGATFAPGMVGQAFSLNGPTSGVIIGNPPALQLQNFTIDAWIKRASATQITLDSSVGSCCGQIFGYGSNGYILGILNDGHLYLSKTDINVVDSTITVTDTNFHHVAVTKTGSTVVFYVDGVADIAPAYDPGFTFNTNAAIGVRSDTLPTSFFGLIDEVEVFNRALAPQEIQAVFNAGAAGKCKTGTVTPFLVSVTPSSGAQGQQNLAVSITGLSTHFVQGVTTASFGPGVTVVSLTVNSPMSATAVLNIDLASAVGPRTVTMSTETEVVSLPDGFTVSPRTNQPPVVNAGPDQTVTLPAQEVTFTEYVIPTDNSEPNNIAAGPDGNLWFVEENGQKIGRITPAGIISEFPTPTNPSQPLAIAAGPDGNMWYTAEAAHLIGRVTPSGVITEFPIPTPNTGHMGWIAAGPDGNMWFGDKDANAIGRITTAGSITEFPVPAANSSPARIAAGPDGNMWFTEETGNNIGKITTAGSITEFPLPTGVSVPLNITAGPDGNLWFTASSSIGKITPAGAITIFPLATRSDDFVFIGTGPDGNLWFGARLANVIGRVTPSGIITEFPVPSAKTDPSFPSVSDSDPSRPTSGPDGNVWFVEGITNKVAKLDFGAFTAPAVVPLAGSITDDGLPLGATLTATWSQTDGPAPVSFSQPTTTFPDIAGQVNPVGSDVTLTAPGMYHLSLTGNDTQLSSSSSVTITVTLPEVPTIVAVNPNIGQQGRQNLTINITGQFTHFLQGTTAANFGAGITVASLTVNNETMATAVLNIDPAATEGPRRVTLTTGSEVATLGNGFAVTGGTPVLTQVIPSSGQQGQQNLAVAISGQFTHFVQGTTTANFGPGVSVVSMTVNSAGSATAVVNIDPAAALGAQNVTVTTGAEVVSLAGGFQIISVSGTPVLTQVSPNTGEQRRRNLIVTLTGQFTNWLQGTTTATFGPGISVVSLTVNSPTSATADLNIDCAAPGVPRDVTLTTGTEVDTLLHGFTVVPLQAFLYVSNSGNTSKQIQAFAIDGATGTLTPVPGSPFSLPGTNPNFMAVTPSGRFLYVANGGPTQISALAIDSSTGALTEIPGSPFSVAQGVTNIAIDPSGRFLYATSVVFQSLVSGYSINSATGALTPVSGSPFTTGSNPFSLAVSPSGQFAYVPSGTSGNIPAYSIDAITGALTAIPGSPFAGQPGQFSITESPSGRFVYVAEGSGVSAYTVNAGTGALNAISSSPVPAGTAPRWIAISPSEDFAYVSNFSSNNVSGYTVNGQTGMLTAVPGSPFSAGVTPMSLAVDPSYPSCPFTYVAANGSNDVMVYRINTATGSLTPIANSPFAAGSSPLAMAIAVPIDKPLLMSLNPNLGQQGQQNLIVNLVGQFTSFVQGTTTVDFGAGVALVSTTVSSPTSATAIIRIDPAASPGPRNVTVTTAGEIVTLRNGFTVTNGSPTLALVNPNVGNPGQQSLSVALSGQSTHWAQGITVASFGAGVTVASLVINSSTSATAVLNVDPTASIGTRDVTVTTGAEIVTLSGGFTIAAIPVFISTVNPGLGSQGTTNIQVLITGNNTHFVQGTSVASFGAGITVSSLVVTSATAATATINIDVTAPVGPHAVTITTNGEVATTSSGMFANGFSVVPGVAQITQISPGGGSQGIQNLSVVVTGQFTHFAQGTTTASFGAGVTVVSLTVNSSTSATAVVNIDPAAAVGSRDVVLTTNSEVVTLSNGFAVAGTPALTSVNPNTGRQGQQGLAIAISGQFTHFAQGVTTADFGSGITVASLTVATPTSATAVLNIDPAAAPGSRNVTITTNTETVSLAGSFSVSAGTPLLASVNPSTGQQGQQNLSITITGNFTHFAPGATTADFGAGITVASLTVGSVTSATASLNIDPAAVLGARNVTVTTGSETVTLTSGFIVVAPRPSLTLVSPNTGLQGQQNLVVSITGLNTHFVQGLTQVSFGADVSVNSVTVSGATALTVQLNISASASPGARTVTVVTGAEQVVLPGDFSVQTGDIALTSVSPGSAFQGQTISVTIAGQGTHFVQGVTQIRFGPGVMVGNAIAGDFGPVTVINATTATAQLSILSSAFPNFRTVTAQTGSEQASLANGFLVAGNPFLFSVNPAAANQGQSGSLTVQGAFTHFAQGVTQASFGPGISVGGGPAGGFGPVTVNSPTSITVQLAVDGAAALGLRNVTVQTGTEQAAMANGFSVLGPVIGPAPEVVITSPAEAAEISSLTTVTGTVTSPNLDQWTLEYQSPGSSSFVVFATGTSATVAGSFDPTTLLNGNTVIRLTGIDTSGQTSSTTVTVVLIKNAKVGNFTVSFNDLSVPVAGLPIQVVRTYDSRDKTIGDFGIGWKLDLKTVRTSANVVLGDQWEGTASGGFIQNFCIVPGKPHVVSVAFSDGTTYEFQANVNPQCQQIQPVDQVTVTFSPTGITPPNASLAVAGDNQPLVSGNFPGPILLIDADANVFDPDQFILTLPDGRSLQISRQFGLQSMQDLNGNKLTVTAAGITHSSGKSVSFARDDAGRIAQITDPSGNILTYGYSAVGDLVSFTDAVGNVSTYAYDDNHDLVTIHDPRGVQPIRNDYDASGRLVSHTDAFGNVINYTHNLDTRQEIVTDRLNNVTVNEYDADGNIVKVTDALGGVTQRTYDGRGNLLTEANALGKTRTYTYDAQNNPLTETDPLGNQTTNTYNSRNQVLTITDPLGRVTTNIYDANGNLTSTKDAAGNLTSYTYTANGLRASMTDALGSVTDYQYDGAGNLTEQTDALGNVTAYTYDGNGNKLTETRTRTTSSGAESLVTSYQYDQLNRLTQTTYPDGSITQIQYNAIGKQSVTTDQLARQTSYQYDLMGRLTQTSYPDSTSEQSTYDAEGDRVTTTDRAGRTTTFVYDPLKRLLQTVYPDDARTSTAYDAIGQVSSVTDARGNVTQYAYDDASRRSKVTDALGNATSIAYDAVGNQISMTDANSNVTQYQYDQDNRRTNTIYPDKTSDSVAYDALGRTVSKTDQAGLVTQFQYDKLGRLTQVTDALGQITKYAYDEVGNRLSQTDANSHTTSFVYDKMGRRSQRTLPLGMSESFTYDLAGNLATKTDFNGKTTAYAYDAVNRLTGKTPDASLSQPAIAFTYTSTGQRQTMIDASGTTNYAYDLRDHLTQKATPEGTLSYTYDLAGNLASIRSSNANGTSADYGYDVLNRLTKVTDNRLASGVTTYAYDNAGNLQSYLYPNNVQTSYTYNALNRLTNMTISAGSTGPTLASYGYTLGPAGNRTAVAEFGGRQVGYTYDSLYRLTGEIIAGSPDANGAIGYQYDPVGNRLARTSTVPQLPPATYAYDANDRLTTDAYDANGNTVTSGGNSYAYEFENRLTSLNGGALSIVYDGDGNRVSKTASGVTTNYLVDDRNLTGYSQVLEEISGGQVQRVYAYGLNRISQSQTSGTSFYGYDGHGSVRVLTDAAVAVTDRYDYDAFGNILSETGTTPNVYLYTGEQNDPNLGAYYLRARYANTSSGRFLTTDDFEGHPRLPRSLHSYMYSQGDPVDQADPSGRESVFQEILDKVRLLINSDILDLSPEVQAAGDNTKQFEGMTTHADQELEGQLAGLEAQVNSKHGAACNIFVSEALEDFWGIELFGRSTTNPLSVCYTSTQILNRARNSSSWAFLGTGDSQTALNAAQRSANWGEAVIAVSSVPNHVALVIPGDLLRSGSWNLNVPNAAWTSLGSPENARAGARISGSWTSNEKGNVNFFAYEGLFRF